MVFKQPPTTRSGRSRRNRRTHNRRNRLSSFSPQLPRPWAQPQTPTVYDTILWHGDKNATAPRLGPPSLSPFSSSVGGIGKKQAVKLPPPGQGRRRQQLQARGGGNFFFYLFPAALTTQPLFGWPLSVILLPSHLGSLEILEFILYCFFQAC